MASSLAVPIAGPVETAHVSSIAPATDKSTGQAALVATAADVTIDFTSVTPQNAKFTFTLKLNYGNAAANYTGSFDVGLNSTNKAVAAAVYGAIPKSIIMGGQWTEGYDVSIDASGLIVTIKQYRDGAGGTGDIKAATFGGGYDNFTPGITYQKGNPGGATAASTTTDTTPLAFSFAPTPYDGDGILQSYGQLEVQIDGMPVSVQVSQGETYLQVANDLFTTLVMSGLTNVVNDGNGDIVVYNDYSGQSVSSISMTLDYLYLPGAQFDTFETGVGVYPAP